VLKGRHVLYGLLGGFGVILIANGAFVYFATTTFPGNEVSDSYRRGLAYNETLRADEAQRSSGVTATVSLAPAGLAIDLSAESEGPLAGIAVTGEVRRPGRPDLDREVVFREVDAGRYLAPVELSPGRWIVTAQAVGAGGTLLFRLEESLEIDAR